MHSNSNQDQDIDDKAGGDKHRRGLFKLSGFRFTFKGRSRKSHPGCRSDSDKGMIVSMLLIFQENYITLSFDSKNDHLSLESLHEADSRSSNRQSQSSFAEMRALQLGKYKHNFKYLV